MQVQVTEIAPLSKQIVVSYSPAEVETRVGQLVKGLASRAKVDGFRPGKANRALLEKRHGAEARSQAQEDLANEGLQAAFRDHKINPIGGLEQDPLDHSDGLKIVVRVEVHPEVKLPAAASITTVDTTPGKATDKEIETFIESMSRRGGKTTPLTADETVLEDDKITVTGSLKVGDKEVKAVHDMNHLVGSYPLFGAPTEAVIAACAGKTVGQTITLNTTLADTFQPAEFAKAQAVFTATIQTASRLRAVPIDDALAVASGAADLADLRNRLRFHLDSRAMTAKRGTQVESLVEYLVANVTVPLPAKILATVTKNAGDQAATGKTGAEADTARAAAVEAATKDLKKHIILEAVAQAQQVTVTNEDLHDQIRMASQQTGRDPRAIAQQLQKSGQISQVSMEIRHAKGVEIFLDEVIAAHQPAQTAAAGA